MTHRFYLLQQLDKEIIVIKDRATVHQMRNVLKLRKGEKVAFFSDKPEYAGFDFVAELKNIEGIGASGQAVFMLREKTENARELSKKMILYQSLIKKDKFEWVLEKATEVGVSEIVPVISARAEKKSLNAERCWIILKEAAEQSGRAVVPKLYNPLSFERALNMAVSSGAKTYFGEEKKKEKKEPRSGRQENKLIYWSRGWLGRARNFRRWPRKF